MREPRDYEAPLCSQVGGDLWFPEQGGDTTNVIRAKRVCQICVHRIECRRWGVLYERHGIWGGTTPQERKRIRRKNNIILPREKSA